MERPILQAIRAESPPVLLMDEIDRADEEFEAFLLEFLSDFQVSIPELGTVKAERPPLVVLTSNRSRELSEALKRRCLHLQLDYPDAATELEIVRLKAPGIGDELAGEMVDGSRASAASTCARRRASGRRSTGRRRWSCSRRRPCRAS